MEKHSVSWLVENNIASFSPHISIKLIEVAEEIAGKARADKKMPPNVREEIKRYAQNLLDVAQTGGQHQGEIIKKLSSLLGHPKPAWTKEKVEP